MGYHLGVDLGTTFSAAAAMGDGPPTMIGLGNRALQIPSVLYFLPDGGVLVGEAAEHRSGSDPSRTVREFKRRIGDPVPILVAGRPFSAQALSGRLLRWVVDKSAEQMGERPVDITLTYPANWGHFKIDLMRQVAMLADVDSVRACSEPEAAALQYASRSRVNVGDRIAVYDLGGGTFDVCVLEKTETGFQVPGRPEGIEHLGGIDFDEAIFQRVISQLPADVIEAAIDDAEQMPALARLRRDCVEAKESLSTDVDAVIPVALVGARTSIRLTRGEFEDIIRPALEDTIGATRRALRSAETEPSELTAMVLVGGSSRIPLIAELLGSAFRCPIAVDTHPKNDVAMGAARAGALAEAGMVLTAPSRRQPSPSVMPRAPELVPAASGSAPDVATPPEAQPNSDLAPGSESAAATVAGRSARVDVPDELPFRSEPAGQSDAASLDPTNSDRTLDPDRVAGVGSPSRRSRWMVVGAGVGVVLAAGLTALIVTLSRTGGETGQATIRAAATDVVPSSNPSSDVASSPPVSSSTAPPETSPTSTPAGTTSGSTQSTTPIGPTQVQVSSTEPWTDTGVACTVGGTLEISATGTILHNKDDAASTVDPDGLTEPAFRQYNVPGLPDVNTVALIGSLDQAQPYFLVGSAKTLACPAAGELFLGVNDAGLANNSGSFDVTIVPQAG